MFFEIQSAFLKSWLQLAEASTKAMNEAVVEFSRASGQAWLGALGIPQPAKPLFPFSFPTIPGAYSGGGVSPFLPAFNPAMMTGLWMQSFQPAAPVATFPNAFALMSPWMSAMGMARPFGSQPSLSDIIASSYRTAGGHAAAAVITAPYQSYENPALWWTKPAGRGWLN